MGIKHPIKYTFNIPFRLTEGGLENRELSDMIVDQYTKDYIRIKFVTKEECEISYYVKGKLRREKNGNI